MARRVSAQEIRAEKNSSAAKQAARLAHSSTARITSAWSPPRVSLRGAKGGNRVGYSVTANYFTDINSLPAEKGSSPGLQLYPAQGWDLIQRYRLRFLSDVDDYCGGGLVS